MGRPRYERGGGWLLGAPLPAFAARSSAADHSVHTLFLVGGVLILISVVAIVVGAWGGRRRK